MAEKWQLAGKVLVACNCDWGCPCNFNARPTTGKCEGGWTWQINRGTYGDVRSTACACRCMRTGRAPSTKGTAKRSC